MKIKDILREPYTYFDVNDRLKYIATTFNERHISSAPVVKEGVLVGMVSDSSIVKKFMPKKFFGIWTYDEPAPVALMKKMTADLLLEKVGIFVLPEDDILDVLPLVVGKHYDCIPVIESKESMRLVGIVRGSDLMRIFLRYFAANEAGTVKSENIDRLQMETIVGRILSLVEDEGSISSDMVAKKLNITKETVERIGAELERHGLINVKYKFFASPVFEKIERLG